MPSERITRRIDGFLDEAEQALAENQWALVVSRCRAVLALDPGNEDAAEYIAAAERASAGDAGLSTDHPVPEAQPEPESPDPEQSVADGRYVVQKFLGEGGKKKVYLARDTTLDISVALAHIKTDGLDAAGRQRIKREAQAMARLGTHPHVVPIYNLGEEGGRPYMVLPLMAGGDVEGLLEEVDGPLGLDRAIEIAMQTAQGLAFAHSKGIVHRDLKPGNVWMDEDGIAKIGDFGLAVATDRTRLTVEKVMVGTVSYMPPEQATGGELTPRADIYSLGAMLYEMCTGRVPFMGDDDIAVISQHINTPPVAPSWHNKLIPQTLDSLIMRMLAKDPAERPESAEEVIAALEAVDLSAASDDHAGDKGTGSLDSMAGGVFVGRHREMDQLKAMFEEVLSGKGRMVTLVGEPGIGKTRTAQELATYASTRGAEVLWGRSYEGGGEPAYWPWVRAMRSLVSEADPATLRRQLGSFGPVIADLVGEVRQALPDLPKPIPIDDQESARFRLFDAIATFLRNASRNRPVVVMLEDLHWADRPSLMLLEFVAREIANSKLMIVGNYRDVELSRRHPLAVTLGELGRERRFDRVLLKGLQRHDVERFIEIAAGISPPAALVDTVHTQTEGNPLFVTETVRLLIQEGDIASGQSTTAGTTSWEIRIPEGVKEVIGRRLDRLSERCNEVLTTAAVMGRHFRFPVLLNLVSDVSENMLLDVMDEALAARIVEELPEEIGLYQFTHALMQETLKSELSANRTVRMHARVAEALEQFYGDQANAHAAELSEHFAEAETVLGPDRMVRYAMLAGQEAATTFAWDEALLHYQRAVSAKEALNPGESSKVLDEEAVQVLKQLGRAQSALLMSEEAASTLRRVYEHYVAAGDYSSAVEIVTESPTAELVNSALELIPQDSHDAGKLLAWRGRIVGLAGNYDDAEMDFYNAMAISQREADQALALRVMINSFEVDIVAHHYGKDGLEKGRRYIEIARSAGDKLAEAEAQIQTTWQAMYVGDTTTGQQHARQFKALADELRLRRLQRLSLVVGSGVAQSLGDFEEAKSLAQQGVGAEDHFQLVGCIADIGLELGDFDSARKWLENLLNIIRRADQDPQDMYAISNQGSAVLVRTLVKACRYGYEPKLDAALRAVLDAEDWSSSSPDMLLAGVMYRVHSGQLDGLEEAIESLESNRNIYVAPYAHVSRVMALGLTALGQYDRAEELFEEAIDFCKEAGYKPELAWALADYRDMLAVRNADGDQPRVDECVDEAIGITRALGMKPLLEQLLSRIEIKRA